MAPGLGVAELIEVFFFGGKMDLCIAFQAIQNVVGDFLPFALLNRYGQIVDRLNELLMLPVYFDNTDT